MFSITRCFAVVQHTYATIGQTKNADALAAAWEQYKLPGMLDVEDLHTGTHCPPRGCFKDGLYHREWSDKGRLNLKWQDILGTALSASKAALKSGAIKGAADQDCDDYFLPHFVIVVIVKLTFRRQSKFDFSLQDFSWETRYVAQASR